MTPEYKSAFLDPSSLQDYIPWGSYKRSLKRIVSALLKSKVVVLVTALVPPLEILKIIITWLLQPELPLTSPSLTSSLLFVSTRSSRTSFLVGCPCREVVINALQCCIARVLLWVQEVCNRDAHSQAQLHELQLLFHWEQVPVQAFPWCPSWRAYIHLSQHPSHVTAETFGSSCLFPTLPASEQRWFRDPVCHAESPEHAWELSPKDHSPFIAVFWTKYAIDDTEMYGSNPETNDKSVLSQYSFLSMSLFSCILIYD